MSYQLALCSRIVRTGDIVTPINFGITSDDFTSVEGRHFWDLLLNYYTQRETRGSVIPERIMNEWFKQLMLHDHLPGMEFLTLCYNVRRERVVAESTGAIVHFSEAVSIPTCNPATELSALQSKINRLIALGTTANSDVNLKSGLDSIQRRLKLAASGVDLSIVRWPWEALQNATFGIQPDDYIVFYGRPKSMKTWVLCYLIAWCFEHGKKLVVYTKEMTPDNIYMRVVACIAQMVYSELREATHGKPLNDLDNGRLLALMQYIEEDPSMGDLLTVLSGRDVAAGGDTVAWLQSKISQYGPHLLFVDGLYLLSDEKKSTTDHVRVMNISRALRQLNLDTQVPVIATMQANRKAAAHGQANLDEIAYSDALSQDCTIAMRVIADKVSPTISLVIGGSREFKLHGVRIHGVPATNFGFHSVLTEKDIEKAKEGDTSDVEEKKAKGAKSAKSANGSRTEKKEAEAQLDKDVDLHLKMSAAATAAGR